MKQYVMKIVIILALFLVMGGSMDSVYGMGWNPWRSGNHHNGGGNGTPTGVPDPVTAMTLLGVGVAGVGGYLLLRNKKDK